MTARFLSNELGNLIQESKRKNAELRSASEKSLEELKNLRDNEPQISTDLGQRPNFVTPFLIACSTKNPKFTGIAIVCLHRLVVSRALPRSRLKDVIEAFREAISQGQDVQLKILQALPSLLQNYASDLRGDLLAGTLSICSSLQTSKNPIINNTAAATLQQLVVSVFDKVGGEDKRMLEIPTVGEAPTDDGVVQLRAAALDAYRVFNDLCLLTESQKPQFLRATSMPVTFGLELIESILTNHAGIFLTHPEQATILRARVMPYLINSLSEKLSFAATVRIIRVLYTLLREHLTILVAEGEMALGLLTYMLDPDAAPLWKRALCMEVFRGIFGDADLVRKIFALYDVEEGKKTILRDLVATFVRLSTEKPSAIGLGPHSTIPVVNNNLANMSNDQALLEASGVPGIIGGPVSTNETNAPGISTQWSNMRVPIIDQLANTEAPSVPESYIYSLTLTCINSFSEGLAKFILPLTVPASKKSGKGKQNEPSTPDGEYFPIQKIVERRTSFKRNPIPVNPLTLSEHPLYSEIKICAAIVDECWPAILATCSTFLYAALDSDYYHGLVRAFQKFTHVAGLLRLTTPRDAFLTTLGKSAVPPNILTANIAATSQTPSVESSSIFSNPKGLLSVDSLVSQASATSDRRQSAVETAVQSLNTRNLLCLRALLNLGIALGPTLDSAWVIILETLQQADFVLFSASRSTGKNAASSSQKSETQVANDSSALLINFGSEIKSVETAVSRLFESTVDFPNDSFLEVVSALCRLFARDGDIPENGDRPMSPNVAAPPSPTFRRASKTHRRVHSTISQAPATQNHEDGFALAKLGDVAKINIQRLVAYEPNMSGWDVLVTELISTSSCTLTAPTVRLHATEVLIQIILDAAACLIEIDKKDTPVLEEERGVVQWRLLDALRFAIKPLQAVDREASVATHTTDIDTHKMLLEGFKNLLEKCGESLVSGWDVAFEIIGSVFLQPKIQEVVGLGLSLDEELPSSISKPRHIPLSSKLVRSSFSSLQLICSDFLSCLPSSCFLILVDTLYNFCAQDDDLNICLTTVTFFWVLSDHILRGADSFSLDSIEVQDPNEQALVEQASSEDRTRSDAALWMILLIRLTAVTTDDRLELRNSSIQTLLSILNAYGDKLSPRSWSICLRTIILKLLHSIEEQLRLVLATEPAKSDKEKLEWHETTMVVISGISGLLSDHLQPIAQDASFKGSWRNLLEHFSALLAFNVLDINTAVFKGLQRILSQADVSDNVKNERIKNIERESVSLAWEMWSQQVPLASASTQTAANNQPCLEAYVSSLQEIYRLMQDDLEVSHVQRILALLRDTIQRASPGTYTADIEFLTTLQTQVLNSIKMIRTDVAGIPAALIFHVAELVAMAFERKEADELGSRYPTYVALSKESMTLIETLILAHASNKDLYESGGLTSSLLALGKPIALKYAFRIQTKSQAPWQLATTTSLKILEATLPMITKDAISEDHTRAIWTSIVTIANGITAADCAIVSGTTDVKKDQAFDIESFRRLRDLITPALGAQVIPDKTRRAYTESLFNISLIHQPEAWDLPQPNEPPLACLLQPRKGRTIDPPASPRSKMSYVCLDELFTLVSCSSSSVRSQARLRLAQAAAPYLIIRAGLTLKSYIADQPLRGRMPQPLSQRKELLYILRALVGLECEPKAIPELDGMKGESMRGHLHRLYSILVKAVGPARGDQEVSKWIVKALEEVGRDFGA